MAFFFLGRAKSLSSPARAFSGCLFASGLGNDTGSPGPPHLADQGGQVDRGRRSAVEAPGEAVLGSPPGR